MCFPQGHISSYYSHNMQKYSLIMYIRPQDLTGSILERRADLCVFLATCMKGLII